VSTFRAEIELTLKDAIFLKKNFAAGKRDPLDALLGDAFEIAASTWVGSDARDYVMTRIITGQFNYEFDWICGPYGKKTDAKCAQPQHENPNMIVRCPKKDVAYLFGQLLNSMDDLVNGKALKFGLVGWRSGADHSVFREGQFGPTVAPFSLQDLGSYLLWLRQP